MAEAAPGATAAEPAKPATEAYPGGAVRADDGRRRERDEYTGKPAERDADSNAACGVGMDAADAVSEAVVASTERGRRGGSMGETGACSVLAAAAADTMAGAAIAA